MCPQVQLREGEGNPGPGEGDKLSGMGRRRAREVAASVEELHPVYGRHSVRAGLCGRRENGGGQDGVGEDRQVPGQRRSPHSDPR